ncbi:hypothetical protein CBM2615_B70006 [Cupriavidus taiwanensis]|uniref:Uncharacterized protein n=1 Tax=Cupriavidus taiwanensis TaxID=164546 RepID=A0A976B2M7_9BURK|nr:hypothetical protein CBM2615_B70006 [Cupriavidus taiwanensis]SOZ72994.1 hypothetical protein CBM2613_B50136 [Cupriavidus taiwanensis]SPA09896.1 hypothetical protein CBM2625_B60052 [Cupriavidus taiwanensis]
MNRIEDLKHSPMNTGFATASKRLALARF